MFPVESISRLLKILLESKYFALSDSGFERSSLFALTGKETMSFFIYVCVWAQAHKGKINANIETIKNDFFIKTPLNLFRQAWDHSGELAGHAFPTPSFHPGPA